MIGLPDLHLYAKYSKYINKIFHDFFHMPFKLNRAISVPLAFFCAIDSHSKFQKFFWIHYHCNLISNLIFFVFHSLVLTFLQNFMFYCFPLDEDIFSCTVICTGNIFFFFLIHFYTLVIHYFFTWSYAGQLHLYIYVISRTKQGICPLILY